MKKALIVTMVTIVTVLLGISVSFAQPEKGGVKFTISGLTLLGNSEYFGSSVNGFVIKPTLGYYLSEKTSVELNFTYAFKENLQIENIDGRYNSVAIVPVLRNIS